MVNPVGKASPLLLGGALWSLSLLAAAQNQPSEKEPEQRSPRLFFVPAPSVVPSTEASKTEKSDKPADNVVNSFGVLSSEQAAQLDQQVQQRQAELRKQLADPKQRVQLVAERIEQQRSLHPDLAAVLRLDSRTEDKLFALLADQQLSQELQPRRFGVFEPPAEPSDGKPYNPMRAEAVRYTQQMNEIAKVLGAVRLDDYVDYQRKLSARSNVARFEAVLPTNGKLTLDQRNALTDLFDDQINRSILAPRGNFARFSFDLKMTPEERERRSRVVNIVTNEQFAALAEAANRELIDRATAVLTPEQTTALADWKQQEQDRQRAWALAQRKALGVGPDEKLEDPADEVLPSPPISKNLLLTIDLTVNDTQVVRKLMSVRGNTVTFEGPEGLVAEVRPYMDQDRFSAELKLYEKVRGGRRLVGGMSGSAQLIEKGKPSLYGGSGGTMAQGRKGYAINWSVSGTYL